MWQYLNVYILNSLKCVYIKFSAWAVYFYKAHDHDLVNREVHLFGPSSGDQLKQAVVKSFLPFHPAFWPVKTRLRVTPSLFEVALGLNLASPRRQLFVTQATQLLLTSWNFSIRSCPVVGPSMCELPVSHVLNTKRWKAALVHNLGKLM